NWRGSFQDANDHPAPIASWRRFDDVQGVGGKSPNAWHCCPEVQIATCVRPDHVRAYRRDRAAGGQQATDIVECAGRRQGAESDLRSQNPPELLRARIAKEMIALKVL